MHMNLILDYYYYYPIYF